MASLFGMTLNSLPAWLGGGGPTKANIPPLQGQPYPSQDDVAFAQATNDASLWEAMRRRSCSRLMADRSIRQILRTSLQALFRLWRTLVKIQLNRQPSPPLFPTT